MAFKEIQYWASIINDDINSKKNYVDVCNKSIKTAKLNESKKIQDIDEDVIDPEDSGFSNEKEYDYEDVFKETPDPLKEKIDASQYLEREDDILEDLDEDDGCYATICVKFNDQDEDGLTKNLKELFQNYIDIDCQNLSDNSTDYPIYKLIGPLCQLKHMFAHSHKDCNSFNDLPDCCQQKFNKCLNTNDALDESDFFTFKGFDGDVNPSTANLVKPNEVKMSIVAEKEESQKKTEDYTKLINGIYDEEYRKLKDIYKQKSSSAIRKHFLTIKDQVKSIYSKANPEIQNRIKIAVSTISNIDDGITRNPAFMSLLWLDILVKSNEAGIQISDDILSIIQEKMAKLLKQFSEIYSKVVNESLKKNNVI